MSDGLLRRTAVGTVAALCGLAAGCGAMHPSPARPAAPDSPSGTEFSLAQHPAHQIWVPRQGPSTASPTP